MNEIIKLTKDLVNIKSQSNNQKEVKKVLDHIKKHILNNINGCTFDLEISKGIHSLYIKSKINKGAEICLCGHVDVVPAEDNEFICRIDEKWIHGRGAGDMKSGVAVIVELFLKHAKNKNVSLLLTGDEEVGGVNGAKVFSEKINPRLLIVTEPTDNKLLLVEKGGTLIEINVSGPGGHASRPHLAKNVIDILFEIITLLRQSIDSTEKDIWKNTLNIGSIEGGNYIIKNNKINHLAGNVIAKKASARIDIRLTENTKHKEVFKKLDDIIFNMKKKHGQKFSITYKEIVNVEHMFTKEDNEFVKLFKKTCLNCNHHLEIIKGPAASDGRFFSVKGIPVMLFGPCSLFHHSVSEKVEIKSIIKTHKILDAFLKEL